MRTVCPAVAALMAREIERNGAAAVPALLSLPVVYVSAMLVSCYRALLSVTAQQDQSPT